MKALLARNFLRVFGLVPLVSLLGTGCASDSERMEKRLSGMRDEIHRLQNENDRVTERLEAVELRQARDESKAQKEASASTAVTRPRLKVLHLSPDGDDAGETEGVTEAPATPDSAGKRVILKGQGKDLELKPLSKNDAAAGSAGPEQ